MDRERANSIVCELFDVWYPVLVRYAYRSLGKLGIAEDVVQEALMEMYKQLRGGTSIQHPSAWAFSVVRRRISFEVKRHLETTALHVPLDLLDSVPEGIIHPVPFVLESAELLRLSQLSRREEEVLLLRMEAFKYREIAEILGIGSNSVGTLIARALRKLRGLCNPEEQDREEDSQAYLRKRETL